MSVSARVAYVRAVDPSTPLRVRHIDGDANETAFDDSIGVDLRAARKRRTRLMVEILVTLLGAAVLGTLCGVILSRW